MKNDLKNLTDVTFEQMKELLKDEHMGDYTNFDDYFDVNASLFYNDALLLDYDKKIIEAIESTTKNEIVLPEEKIVVKVERQNVTRY